MRHLTKILELPPQMEGLGLRSLERCTDGNFLGPWSSVFSYMIPFLKSTNTPIYEELAKAMEKLETKEAEEEENQVTIVGDILRHDILVV